MPSGSARMGRFCAPYRAEKIRLLVFSFLVVPVAIAFQFTDRIGVFAVISWIPGALASAGGLWVSFRYDLPTGPVVVCMFGLLLLAAYLLRRGLRRPRAAVASPAGVAPGVPGVDESGLR